MKLFTLFTFSISLITRVYSQEMTQNIRGKIVDVDTKTPLIGAKVKILDIEDKLYAAACNYNGEFAIYDVPVRKKGEVINEMATVSSQSFTVEEANRYAGSRGDPARMMSNFAGAQGTDDSRNDLVIRGNSPAGILYKVEGIDIPNPNHFAISGPVSILNYKFLSNSDFFMSAFPAEYGNSTSGVFDLKLRNGNNRVHEFSGQFGFLGTEFQLEGPLSQKSGATYLIGGRYSTFSLLKSMGISIGTDAVPVYGDGAFKFNFPLKNGGAISLFGMGGASQIAILISDQTEPAQDAFGEQDRDQYFGTSMYVTGMTYKKPINSKMFLKTTLAVSKESQQANHNYILRDLDSNNQWDYKADPFNMMGYRFDISKAMAYVSVNYKINRQHLIKYGVNVDAYMFNMRDSVRFDIADSTSAYNIRWDYKSTTPSFLVQPFIQWRYKMTKKLTLNAGVHAQYFSFSNSLSAFEPRVGLKWNVSGNSVIALGSGLHSQTQPMYTYTYHKLDAQGNKILHNQNMDFSKSIHSVLSYSLRLNKSMRFKSEAYYQYLYNIPVEIQSSSFSLVNQGSGFSRFFPDSLQNTGTGTNYGLIYLYLRHN